VPPLVSPPPLLLQLLRGIEMVYSKVSCRDARWMISPFGHIYYPNLGTVRARACGLHSPQIARPTDRPPPFFFAYKSSDRVQSSDSVSPHTAAVSSFSSLFRFPRQIRYEIGDLITIIIMTVTRAAARDGMCTGRITSTRNAKLSKNCVPRWTGSLFNLRSRRAAILEKPSCSCALPLQ